MRTFIVDIIPKIQRYSQKLDNPTLLTDQHWVSIDAIATIKSVFIFRDNNQLLISNNGCVEKAKWDYLGNNSLLIDKSGEVYLFKHAFIDQNVLALKIDSKNEYAIFINENKYSGDINSIEKVIDFLHKIYIVEKRHRQRIIYSTDRGEIEVEQGINEFPNWGDKVFQDSMKAPDGKYKLGLMWYLKIRNGEVVDITHF